MSYDNYDRGPDYDRGRGRDPRDTGSGDLFSDLIEDLMGPIGILIAIVAVVMGALWGLGWVDGQLGTSMQPTVEGWFEGLKTRLFG